MESAADPSRNVAEYSVSEVSAAVKRTVEDAFGHVRIRGEISGFRGVHSSGHCYFSLKDDRARIEAVVWRSAYGKLKFKPEEGVEVVATGRLTTYPGQSKYQIVVEALEPAGVGALMALLEERRKKLAAEGLFGEERKRALPYLPRVIGVVTSPTGAVIRDILHRLEDRFPAHVIVWPVRVQGETAAAEVAAAIRGFNALAPGGPIARPDLLIVARGGGSLEDLWSFNEEEVVRAAADSTIPLISAVGHETDVTLIDHAADYRAPTPTAAAEKAVPVRAELVADVEGLSARLLAAVARHGERLRRELAAAARALPRPDDLLAWQRRDLDALSGRLALALQANQRAHRAGFERVAPRLTASGLKRLIAQRGEAARVAADRLDRAEGAVLQARATGLARVAAGLVPTRLARLVREHAEATARLADRQRRAWAAASERRTTRLARAGGLLEALSYRSVLERGFALVTDDQRRPIRSARAAPGGAVLGIVFHDGEITAVSGGTSKEARKPAPARKRETGPADGSQGSLL